MAGGDASGHRGCHFQRTMRFHKVVIREIQGNRSLKVFNLFAESIGETGKAAAVHPVVPEVSVTNEPSTFE
jgi:hypothetical protein